MYCPQCGAKLPEEARFCHQCGAEVSAELYRLARGSSQVERKIPYHLKAADYAHPDDEKALEQLRRFRPVTLTRNLVKAWDEPLFRSTVLGQSVRIGPNQFADIHAMVRESAAILDMETPEVFIKHNPFFNALSVGVDRPFIILHSSLVDAMDPDELYYVIGHEMGHIKSQHVLFLSTIYLLLQQAGRLGALLKAPPQLIIAPARQALLGWQRKAEFSADRAGLICCQSSPSAISALIKMAVGSRDLFERLNVQEYLRQGEALRGDHWGRVVEALHDHPLTLNRVNELQAYSRSADYARILSGIAETALAPDGEWRPKKAREALEAGLKALQQAQGTLSGIISGLMGNRDLLEQALHHFDAAVAAAPESEEGTAARFYAALALMLMNRKGEAARGFREFVARYPGHQLAPEATSFLRRLGEAL
ncbi:MAG: M48 family metalloprotease [Bacillota bacterium]